MHPGAWFVWALAAGAVAVGTTNPFYLVLLWAVSWTVYALCRRDNAGGDAWRIFVVFGLIALATRTALVFFGPVDAGSVVAAALEGLRLATLLVVFGTFNAVTDPFAVLRLAPRRWHEPALAAALALSIAPRMISAAGQVREAQRLRGIKVRKLAALPAVVVPVLATGMEEAVTLAESMDSRGHGRGTRTRYRPQPFAARSFAVTLGAFAAAGAFVALGVAGSGDATYQPWPLVWPGASAWMVLAVAALALPAAVPSGPREGGGAG